MPALISGTITTATATIFSTTTAAENSDGARCVLAPLDLLLLTKRVSATTALVGDTLTYTVTLTNSSSIPVTGVAIGTLGAGASSVVTFQVLVGSTLPNPNPIPNTATAEYTNGAPVLSNTGTTLVFEPSRGVLFL